MNILLTSNTQGEVNGVDKCNLQMFMDNSITQYFIHDIMREKSQVYSVSNFFFAFLENLYKMYAMIYF